MLDTRNNYRKIAMWIATIAMSALLVIVCLSETYNTRSIIGLCVALLLLCIIGLLHKTKTTQHFRPFILLGSLVYFGFMVGGCFCILFFFQGFILFLMGNTGYWLSFTIILTILALSAIFGAIWCSWLCWLGALQEFIYRKNKLNLLKTEKAQKILRIIQIAAFVALVAWVIFAKRPVLCSYDPFISVFRLRIFNWVGYVTVPLLLISSLLIRRPFCRILCPVGLMIYGVKKVERKCGACTRGCAIREKGKSIH
jgi:polyferredoxin